MLKEWIFVWAATAVALAVAAALVSVIAAVVGFLGVRLFEGPSVQEA
jgi:hypothetical protein